MAIVINLESIGHFTREKFYDLCMAVFPEVGAIHELPLPLEIRLSKPSNILPPSLNSHLTRDLLNN
jgi:hypothetical protein